MNSENTDRPKSATPTEENTPLVSVVMIAYNAEKYVYDAVRSIQNQTYPNWELIFVNDGSTDQTLSIVLGINDPRIRVQSNDTNKGIVYSRNKGLDLCGGKYVAILDSDDVALPDRIQAQVEFLEQNPEIVLCGSFYRLMDESGKSGKVVKLPIDDKSLKSYLFFINCFCHSAIMMRSVQAFDFFYEKSFEIAEDFRLWHRLSKHGRIANLPRVTVLYRSHGNNISKVKLETLISRLKAFNQEKLSSIGINPSEKESDIFANFLYLNHLCFKAPGNLNELRHMLRFIDSSLIKNDEIDRNIVHTIINTRWLLICLKNHQWNDAIRGPGLTDQLPYVLGSIRFLIRKSLNKSTFF